MKKIGLLGLILGLFLVGCATEDLAESPTGTPITLPTEAADVVVEETAVVISETQGIIVLPSADDEEEIEPIDLTEAVGNDEAVIIYSKSGGFAGLEQEWRFYADGRVENSAGEFIGQVEPATITAVVMLADEVGFYELDDEYLDKNMTCCDLITYTLTVTDGEQSKTVVTRDMSPRPPAFVMISTSIDDLIYDNGINPNAK